MHAPAYSISRFLFLALGELEYRALFRCPLLTGCRLGRNGENRPKPEVVHFVKRPFGGPLPKIAYSRSTIYIEGQGTLSDIFLLTGLLEEAHNEDHVDSRQTDSCIR